jgi:UDP-N-acetylglucosamine acyltransferase
MIHPTAVVHPNAKLGAGVRVSPHAVIDADVELGADCVIGPNAYLTGRTVIGARNKFHAGCVIGGPPQDLKYQGDPTRLRIGDDNTFREHVTVNCSTTLEGETVLGSHILMMAGAHVGHDCTVGDHVIIANCTALGGHVTVQNRAVLSASVGIHQFARVGTLSMTQGGSALTQDLPPYTTARHGVNLMCGLNIVGLRRAGVTAEERMELKKAYHLLFRSGTNLRQAVTEAREKFTGARTKVLLDFVATTKRGICRHVGARFGEDEGEE